MSKRSEQIIATPSCDAYVRGTYTLALVSKIQTDAKAGTGKQPSKRPHRFRILSDEAIGACKELFRCHMKTLRALVIYAKEIVTNYDGVCHFNIESHTLEGYILQWHLHE